MFDTLPDLSYKAFCLFIYFFCFCRDLFPVLVEQLKNCQDILEKPELEQHKLTTLIAALQAVVCVAGATTQHKGFSQDR